MRMPQKLYMSPAAQVESARILSRLEDAADQLRALLAACGRPVPKTVKCGSPSASRRSGDSVSFDRHRLGRMVAVSLVPNFDSQEFSRTYRAALSPADLGVMDAVRLKKVLQRLCDTGVIKMITAGRGRTAAHYKVLPHSRG